MEEDITKILGAWSFDPDTNVRKIRGADGVEKIQVRINQGAFQGILQIDLDGRPDGCRPHGQTFALDYYQNSLQNYRRQNDSEDDGFTLDSQACEELFEEGARIYERYAFLLQLKEYPRVIRDTERNMQLFRFVNRYAAEESDKSNLEKWWPYVLRINGTARAFAARDEGDFAEALDIVAKTRERIRECSMIDAEEFRIEMERSEEALETLESELLDTKPLNRKEQLERMLKEAVEGDNFERAAELRDMIQQLALEDI
tara:strand:+ start:162 stop:935 length:774 start_codon:yes stop_codon:yes gene_type:complete